MSSALEIGQQLVNFCREGRNLDAIEQLYHDDIVSVEAMGSEECPQTLTGIEAIKGKNNWWYENNEVHSGNVSGPFPNGDRFAVHFDYDITPKAGPMAGNRMQMTEVGLYTVNNGKITKEEFFYHMG